MTAAEVIVREKPDDGENDEIFDGIFAFLKKVQKFETKAAAILKFSNISYCFKCNFNLFLAYLLILYYLRIKINCIISLLEK